MPKNVQSEIWNGVNQDYLTREDLRNKIIAEGGCNAGIVRCTFAVDVYTEQSGWGTNPEDAIGINLN